MHYLLRGELGINPVCVLYATRASQSDQINTGSFCFFVQPQCQTWVRFDRLYPDASETRRDFRSTSLLIFAVFSTRFKRGSGVGQAV